MLVALALSFRMLVTVPPPIVVALCRFSAEEQVQKRNRHDPNDKADAKDRHEIQAALSFRTLARSSRYSTPREGAVVTISSQSFAGSQLISKIWK